jgi:Flp pilus assembly protein TadG
MQKALQGIFSLFIKTNPPRKRNGGKSRAQSLVEVAIAFPVLIILFSGVVEFGFIINYYLSLVDATRDAARLYSNEDPFCNSISASCPVADPTIDDPDFYLQTAEKVRRTLDPSIDKASYKGRKIVLDPARDDVIVSVYSATGSTVELTRNAGVYHLFPTAGSVNGNYPSVFTTADVTNTRVAGAPNAGILLVEVHYNYHHVLGLPWMTTVIGNPLHLRAYTIMPIRAAEPAP